MDRVRGAVAIDNLVSAARLDSPANSLFTAHDVQPIGGLAMQFFTTAAFLPLAFGLAVVPAIGRIRITGSNLTSLSVVIKMAIVAGGILGIATNAY